MDREERERGKEEVRGERRWRFIFPFLAIDAREEYLACLEIARHKNDTKLVGGLFA